MTNQIPTYDRWLVYGVGQRAPTHEHTSEEQAATEAKRLAREHPGITFFVLKAVRGYRLAETPLDEFVPDPEETPF